MDENSLYPIHGMKHIPFWQTTTFYMVVGFVVIILSSFFVWYLFKRYRLSKQKTKSAWDVALEELDQIKEHFEKKGMSGKTFYFRLTWIFKRYLSGRYRFEVYGKTDEELLSYLEESGLASELVQDLNVVFEGSSTIKFANQQAAKERMARDLQVSIEFIKKTIPKLDQKE